jgi:hypothetical protein
MRNPGTADPLRGRMVINLSPQALDVGGAFKLFTD